jgi:hypothetical protein
MGILSFFMKKTDLPWKDYPSIFAHIKNNINPEVKLGEAARKLYDNFCYEFSLLKSRFISEIIRG